MNVKIAYLRKYVHKINFPDRYLEVCIVIKAIYPQFSDYMSILLDFLMNAHIFYAYVYSVIHYERKKNRVTLRE